MTPPYPIVPGVTFKGVNRFPNYCVGDDGSVWSCHRCRRALSDPLVWTKLKPAARHHGHLQLTLCDGVVRKNAMVHRLVLEAFVGPCPPGMEGCHFPDRDPANNRLENLRWDTQLANMADMLVHGTDSRGEKSVIAKLAEADVVEILKEYPDTSNATCARLAKRFNVTRSAIYRVLRRDNWRHVPIG